MLIITTFKTCMLKLTPKSIISYIEMWVQGGYSSPWLVVSASENHNDAKYMYTH